MGTDPIGKMGSVPIFPGGTMKSRLTVFLVISFFSGQTSAQEKFELKVAEFVGAQHFMTQWLVKWGGKLEKASNGRLGCRHFPGAQKGPAPAHHPLPRTGQAPAAACPS